MSLEMSKTAASSDTISHTSTNTSTKIPEPQGPDDKLKFSSIAGYFFGDIGCNFAFTMGSMFLLSYYTDVAGMDAAAIGTMLLCVRIFDAFADIFAGRIIDSVKTRWGKFRPFLITASIPLFILSILVFYVPSSLTHTEKLIYSYVTYALLGFFYSFTNVPYGSLCTVMTQDPVSRAKLCVARSLGGALTSSLLAFVLGSQLRGADPETAQGTYLTYTIILAIFGYFFFVICFKTSEERVERVVERPSLKGSIGTVAKNYPLLILSAATIFVMIALFSSMASNIYFVRYVLKDMDMFAPVVLTQTLFGAAVTTPLVPYLVKRVGKKKTFLCGTIIGVIGNVSFFFAHNLENHYLMLIPLAVASIGLGIILALMWAMEADTVEYGEYTTGNRIEGLTYSLFSLFRKCGLALGGALPAYIFSISGYIANTEQTETALLGIRSTVSLVPAAALILASIIIICYPLNDERFKTIMTALKERRSTAKV